MGGLAVLLGLEADLRSFDRRPILALMGNSSVDLVCAWRQAQDTFIASRVDFERRLPLNSARWSRADARSEMQR